MNVTAYARAVRTCPRSDCYDTHKCASEAGAGEASACLQALIPLPPHLLSPLPRVVNMGSSVVTLSRFASTYGCPSDRSRICGNAQQTMSVKH